MAMTDPSDPAGPNPLSKRPLWRPDPTQPTHPGRAIDAPSLPPWASGRTPTPAPESAVPTVAPPPPPPPPPPEPAASAPPVDPTLAQQAKAPVPQREPQDRHAVTQEDDSMTAEDPRELARRLAEEAKKRLQSVPPPTPDPEAAVASRTVEERAPAAPARTMTAMEALAAAREAERQRAAAPPPPPPPAQTRSAPTPQWGGGSSTTATEPAQQARTIAPIAQFAAIVLEAFPGAKIEPATAVGAHDVFRALWRAHRARAVHEGDVGLVATACVLLDAVDRVPQGGLAAGRVTLGPNAWAVWVDLERRSVLGVARPAEVYLVG